VRVCVVVWPATQNFPAGLAKSDVCPISQTKELGVSFTKPQPSAFPTCWLWNSGSSGPYLLFSTMLPE